MKHSHHFGVKLCSKTDTSADLITEYHNPHAGNKASFGGLLCSQVVTVRPGTALTLHLTIGKGFVKFRSHGVRVVIVAPDRSQQVVTRQWWISVKGGTGKLKYEIPNGKDGNTGEFIMPVPSDPLTANKDWHKHPTDFLADRGCVALYIQRGYLLDTQLPKPEDPPLAIQEHQFKPMQNDNGLPYIIEYRNLPLSEASKLQLSSSSEFEHDSDNYVISDDEIEKSLTNDVGDIDITKDPESELDDDYQFTESSSICGDESGSRDGEQEKGYDDADDEEESFKGESLPSRAPERRSLRLNRATYTKPHYKEELHSDDDDTDSAGRGARLDVKRVRSRAPASNDALMAEQALGYVSDDWQGDDEEPLPREMLVKKREEQHPGSDHVENAVPQGQTSTSVELPTAEPNEGPASKRNHEDSDEDIESLDSELNKIKLRREEIAYETHLLELRREDDQLKAKQKERERYIARLKNKKQKHSN